MVVKSKDTVVVISGKDKGKQGQVVSVRPADGKITVEGVAMVTKHQKAAAQGQPGGIIHKEAYIDASNVMIVCKKCGKATRVGKKILDDGKKVRVCKKCGAQID
ncbi:MAG: 50S ribosomal protein L24 [Clostridia bacterium]|nr:50S ribosomal protein L24 [Clostridia bacterium]